MKMHVYKNLIFAFLVFCGLAAYAAAQDQDLQSSREALEGVKGVRVKVADLGTDAEARGLITLELQNDIELALRQNGIEVLNQDATYFNPVDSYLKVTINLVKQKFWTYAYSISVQLAQPATLKNGKTVYAVTWQRGEVGMITSRKIVNLRDNVKDHLSIFINDFLAANPK